MWILDRLYDGSFDISERPCENDGEYQRLSESCGKRYAAFERTLNEKQRQDLEELHDAYGALYFLEERASFVHGFRVAMRIFLDSVCEGERELRDPE